MLELTDLLDRKPAKLSGGQRQRVAMGRADRAPAPGACCHGRSVARGHPPAGAGSRDMLELTDLLDRKPAKLSGGQL